MALAICHSIIRKHCGYLFLQSEVNIGTTFTIYLHASAQSTQSTCATEKDIVKSEYKATIMVMDDESMIRNMAKRMLERGGHKVVLAENGQEAIELYNEYFESGRSIDITFWI